MSDLIDASVSFYHNQDYEMALEYALRAMDKAGGNDIDRCRVLTHMAALDIITWRDAQAWENATEAELLARKAGVDSLLCDALVQKGRVCMYAAISEEDSRDQEALHYFKEALNLADRCGSIERKVSIMYYMADVYISLNRFNDPLDQEIYAKAGDLLDEGTELAAGNGLMELLARSVHHKVRYYRQGGKPEEGIACCLEILDSIPQRDYLMRSQINNNLVMLYAMKGDCDSAADAHTKYVYDIEHFMKQKADNMLQEMESRYQVSTYIDRAERLRIFILILAVLVTILVIVMVFLFRSNAIVQKQNEKLIETDRAKEQLLRLVAGDISGSGFISEVAGRLHVMISMSDDDIKAECRKLLPMEESLADDVCGYLVDVVHKRREALAKYGLSSRELEIIRLSKEGLTAAGMADRLSLSVHTINNHRQSIYSKLGVKNNAEMLHKASAEGFV